MLLGDRFELIERVGVGGSASVYRARDTAREMPAAVKVLHSSLIEMPEMCDRFLAEADLMETLAHPGIPELCARSQSSEPFHWFAIEFIEGSTLSRLAADGITDRTLVELGMEVCGALAYLHGRGIVHRDVKPENILIDPLGRARLIDFGIAQNAAARRTQVGDLMGTPGFMPPEQAIESKNAGPPADIYALGISLFAGATRRSGVELSYPSTRRVALDELAPALRAVIDPATRKQVSERFPDATAMEWALAEAMESL